MVRGSVPALFQQFYAAELLQYDATRVGRRTPPAVVRFAFSSVLIAQHTQFAFLVPAQPVRAKQPRTSLITGRNRAPVRHGSPDQLVNLFYCLNLRPDNTHRLNLVHLELSSMDRPLYDPVVLRSPSEK
jgi:hypothetical protein